ncbi:hypothetical protein WMY93_005196 [Mugilogobius chulae]|uniref:Metallo-beta-lactamase domain-containing protein n=1 Tax=Mugilogobius chulae TaxID=88201 RepID=A0AAW0PQL5_9GOBI
MDCLCSENMRQRLAKISLHILKNRAKDEHGADFPGTGSAYPSPHRGASALVLRTDGECWMFDCGEGTQTQIMKSHIRAGRITKVFISHLHGDHVFGLPGLLCTVSLNMPPDSPQKLRCVDIYGPRGLRHFLRVTLGLTSSQLLFPYAVHELEPTPDQSIEEGQLSREVTTERGSLHPQEQEGLSISLDHTSDSYLLFEDDRFEVRAFRLFHRVPSFGFCVQEKDRPGRLRTELLKELGVKPGPLYGRLKSGESLTLDSGRVVTPAEVLDEDIPGRKVCVLGDCSLFWAKPLYNCAWGRTFWFTKPRWEMSSRTKQWSTDTALRRWQPL